MEKLARKAHTHARVRNGAWVDELGDEEGGGRVTRARTAALKSLQNKGARRHDVIGMSVMGYGKPVYDPFAAAHLPLSIQLGFRRKMLGTLALQLAATLVLTTILLFGMTNEVVFPLTGWVPDGKNATKEEEARYNGTNYTPMFIMCTIWGILLCIMFCFKHVHPANYVLLTLFTVFEAFSCALWSAFFASSEGVTLFAFFPRIILFAAVHTPIMMFWATRIQKCPNGLPDDAIILPDGEIGYKDEYKP